MRTEEGLMQFEKAWDMAIENNDVAAIDTFMSDDWIIVGTGSGITTKAEFMESIRSGDITHNKMHSDYTRIKIYDNTGVVTSRGTSAGKFKGVDFELYEWSVSTFIYKDNRWICVITMLTLANRE